MTKQFRNIHIYLSLFFLPLALMYALTGTLYICGFDQDSGAIKHSYVLNQAFKQEETKDVMLQFLSDNNLKIPSDLTLKTKRGAATLGNSLSSQPH